MLVSLYGMLAGVDHEGKGGGGGGGRISRELQLEM